MMSYKNKNMFMELVTHVLSRSPLRFITKAYIGTELLLHKGLRVTGTQKPSLNRVKIEFKYYL